MLTRKEPSPVFYDNQRDHFAEGVVRRSNEHYLPWLAGVLGLAWLCGFVIATTAFMSAFLRGKARLTIARAALGAFACFAVLAMISRMLSLRFPEGLLLEVVALPWPLV